MGREKKGGVNEGVHKGPGRKRRWMGLLSTKKLQSVPKLIQQEKSIKYSNLRQSINVEPGAGFGL